MSKKKKIQLNKVLFNNRHCAIFMLIVFVVFAVMLDSFVVNADSLPESVSADVSAYGGSGSYTLSGTLASHFDMESPYPVITRDLMVGNYTGNVNNIDFPQNFSFYADNNAVTNSGILDYYNSQSNYSFVVPVSVSANNNTLSLNTGAYYMGYYCWNSANSQKFFYNYRFWSSGHIAFIQSPTVNGGSAMVVSDQPIQYIYTRGMAYFGDIVTVGLGEWDVQGDNGLYNYILEGFPMYIPYTDMPIYIPSSDGGTGFTNFTPSATDFSFSGDNYNFNNLLRSGQAVDPNAPSAPVESDIEKVSKSNMIFTSSDRWSGDTLSGMYHTYNFNANNYMKEHGEQFQIVVKHWAVYRDNTMQVAQNFDFPDYTLKVDMLLAGSPTGVFTIPLDLHNMKDSNGVSIRQYLLNTIYTTTGTNQQFIDINSMGTENTNGSDGGNIVTGGSSGDYWIGSDGVKHYTNSPSNNKVIIKAVYENVVEDFTIYGSIYVRTAPPDYNYETDSNDTHYNVKNGGFGIDKNGGANQLYPPEEGSGVITPTINTNPSGGGTDVSVSGGSISNILRDLATSTANAIIESGAIQNVVHGGSIESGAVVVNTGGGGFQISNQDWNEYGNLIESMGEDMRAVSSGDGYSGVFQMFANAYSVFPAKVWALITLGIGGSVTLALWKKGTQCH